jgi:transposase InsO family protein
VNHKRVLRLMREESLLCQLKRRWVRTTDADHGLTTYPNPLKQAGWRSLTGTDQAWVADITYIRLPQGFCYLAAILDAYSRKVVGWALSEKIDARLVVAALEQALATRKPPAGWIHHSDQGVQYACRDYVAVLQTAQARISMSGRGRPRDNAQAESFMRTLNRRRCISELTRAFQKPSKGSDALSILSTTRSVFIHRWGTARPANSSNFWPLAFFPRCVSQKKGSPQYEPGLREPLKNNHPIK